MRRKEKITAVMTADPITVQVGQGLSVVARILQEKGFHHLPVLDGESLAGLITSTDLLRVSYQRGVDPRQVETVLDHTVALADLMVTDLVTIREDASVRDAVALLAEHAFHSLPVVDDDGRLVGIVTTTDLLRYMLQQY